MIYLDTHVVIWLYQGELKRLSAKAKKLIENHEVAISRMVLLEIEYLYEINRIKCDARTIFEELNVTIALKLEQPDFAIVIEKALDIKWTRDTFDRLITATALVGQHQLVSKDKVIGENYPHAVWN